MITTLIILAFAIVAVIVGIKNREAIEDGPAGLFKPILILVVGIIVGFVQPYTYERVDAGYAGIKAKLAGSERGVQDYQYKMGWTFYNTWTEQMFQYPTVQQHIEYDTMEVIVKGGFPITIEPSFNYSLKQDKIGEMFTNLRLDVKKLEQQWLKNAIVGAVSDEGNRWEVDSIFNYKEKFEQAIIASCNSRVSKWFMVTQLRTNITPPPSLKQAIIDKTKAIQDAQTEYQRALVADAQRIKKIAIARGDSAKLIIDANAKAQAMRIDAEGEADAMKDRQKNLTPQYIEYIRASNWNGVYPTTMLGNGTQALFNLK